MAAAHGSAEDFELLWERMELFPFAWWQIPLCSWEDAFVAYGEHWEGVLESVEDTRHAWKLLKDETDRSINRVARRLQGLRAAFRFPQCACYQPSHIGQGVKDSDPRQVGRVAGEI